jgi:cell division protein FtsA
VGSLLVDFGGGTISLVVFEEGIPISLEVFPLGSTHITHDIALGLQLPIEEAEILKVSFGAENFSKRKLADIIEARLGDIFDLIGAHLKKIGRSGLLPGGLVLIGGGANLAGIADLAKSYLRLPASVGGLKELPGSKEELIDSSWSVALGLCLLAAEEEHSPGSITGVTRRTKNTFLRWLHSFLP